MLFGFGFVPMKIILQFVDPRGVALIRMCAAALAFFPLAIRRWPENGVTKSDWKLLILCALAGIAGNQLFFVWGLEYTTAAHSSIIITSVPVLTLIFAVLVGAERLSRLRILGFILSFLGVAYLMGIDRLQFSRNILIGDLLTLLNSSCYAIYLVLARPLPTRYSSFWVTAMLFTIGSLVMIPVGLPSLLAQDWTLLPARAWWSLGYVVIVMTLCTYGGIMWLLRRTDSSHIAQGIYIQPMIAIFTARWILGDPITPRILIAMLLVFSGVAVTQLRRMKLPQLLTHRPR